MRELQNPTEIDIDLSPHFEERPEIGEFGALDALNVMTTYVRRGSAAAARQAMTLDVEPGHMHDAVQWHAGRYSGFTVGSYALARAIVPTLEQRVDLDIGPSREYLSAAGTLSTSENGDVVHSMGSMPVNGKGEMGTWQDFRTLWREAIRSSEFDIPGSMCMVDDLIEHLRDVNGRVDLKQVAFAASIGHMFSNVIGEPLGTEEVAVVAEMLTLQEKASTEEMVTGFRSRVGFLGHTARYNRSKQAAGDILTERLFNGNSKFGNRVLSLRDGNVKQSMTEVLLMTAGARGLGNGVYWSLQTLSRDPIYQRHLRDEGTDAEFERLTYEAMASYPGAWVASRTPRENVQINLHFDDETVAELQAGLNGRIILSSYLWGQHPRQKDPKLEMFGVGRRRCPGEKVAVELGPAMVKHITRAYDVEFPPVELSGHGLSLSPRPDAKVTITPLSDSERAVA